MLKNDGYKRHILNSKKASDNTVNEDHEQILSKQDIAIQIRRR